MGDCKLCCCGSMGCKQRGHLKEVVFVRFTKKTRKTLAEQRQKWTGTFGNAFHFRKKSNISKVTMLPVTCRQKMKPEFQSPF